MKIKLNLFKGKNQIEFARKLIHIASIILPIYYKYFFKFNRKLTISVLLLMIAVCILFELLRLENHGFKKFFNWTFGIMLRKHEVTNFTGASYLLTSAIVCIAFYPPNIAFMAIAFLSIGDTFAALVGMNFGKRKFKNSQKSFEGFLACFCSTFAFGILIIYLDRIIYDALPLLKPHNFIPLNPVLVFFGAIAASCAEVINIPLDDNMKIPIWSGFVMTITYLFVG